MGFYQITLTVTLEQENAIIELFSDRKWLYQKQGMCNLEPHSQSSSVITDLMPGSFPNANRTEFCPLEQPDCIPLTDSMFIVKTESAAELCEDDDGYNEDIDMTKNCYPATVAIESSIEQQSIENVDDIIRDDAVDKLDAMKTKDEQIFHKASVMCKNGKSVSKRFKPKRRWTSTRRRWTSVRRKKVSSEGLLNKRQKVVNDSNMCGKSNSSGLLQSETDTTVSQAGLSLILFTDKEDISKEAKGDILGKAKQDTFKNQTYPENESDRTEEKSDHDIVKDEFYVENGSTEIFKSHTENESLEMQEKRILVPVKTDTDTEEQSKTLQCIFCNETFQNMSNLELHMKSSICQRVCKYCGKYFEHLSWYKRHLRHHLNVRPFKCSTCGLSFHEKSYMLRHQKTVHGARKREHVCEICGASFPWQAGLYNHKKNTHSNEKFQCQHCSRVYQRIDTLRRHVKVNHGNEEIPCSTCGKTFRDRKVLKRHEQTHGTRDFKCSYCPSAFTTHALLKNHTKRHENSHSCNQCDKKFYSGQALRNHLYTHTGEKPHACTMSDIVKDEFNVEKGSAASFRSHPENESLEMKEKRIHVPVIIDTDTEDQSKNLQCHACHKKFQSMSNLELHMKSSICQRVCKYCGKYFEHLSWYKRHLRRHLNVRPFQCSTCGLSFHEKSYMLRHQKTVHGAKKSDYVCEICGASFPWQAGLWHHKKNVHSNEKFQCQHCSRVYKRIETLRRHMKVNHGNEELPCSICGKTFRDRKVLKRHEQTHGTRDFKCSYCPSAFTTPETLRNHTRRHKKAYSHSCDQCDKQFYSGKTLREHVYTHTGEKPHACALCDFRCAFRGNLKKHMKVHFK